MRRVIPLIAALALALAAASAGEARQRLVSADPPVGGQVGGARQISITFSEPVLIQTVSVALRGPGGESIPTGPPVLDPANDHHVTLPITASLISGTYRVTWHAVSADTHPVQGAYTFTVG